LIFDFGWLAKFPRLSAVCIVANFARMPDFQNVLREFAQKIKRNLNPSMAAQPEDLLKRRV
jgi:hypothetical protein